MKRGRDDRTYEEAAHAVQSGIAFLISSKGENEAGADAKHLRTGLDMRAADAAGLVHLLIRKGVFTLEEYVEAVRISANEEANSYEKQVSKAMGKPVTLA